MRIQNDLVGPGATSRVTGAYFADGDRHLERVRWVNRRTGEEVMRLLQTTQRELHQTVVMVTHDLDMARQTQRILQISDGVIAADTGRDVP